MSAEQDSLQFQRFEFKYVIEQSVALEVRNFVRSYLEMDKHGAGRPNFSYPIHSVYLDSPELRLYQATVNGNKNRFKLRLRFYDDGPASPVFCELKQRKNRTIIKQRGTIHRSAVDRLLAGYLPALPDLMSDEPRQHAALDRFHRWIIEMQAQPRTHVAYLREAWVARRDNSVRVTMDREVLTETEAGAHLNCRMIAPVSVFGDKVILEIKFTDRFPDWLKDMVQIFGLTKCSAAKYVDGVTLLGPHAVSRAFCPDNRSHPAPPQPPAVEVRQTSGSSDYRQAGAPEPTLVTGLHE